MPRPAGHRAFLSLAAASLLVLACTSPAPAPVASQPQDVGSGSSATAASESASLAASSSSGGAPGPCEGLPGVDAAVTRSHERLTVLRGKSYASATGLRVRFEGTSHDSFADGRTDLHASLTLSVEGAASEAWGPSILAKPQPAVFLGHCLRIGEASEAALTIDVARTAVGEALKPCAKSPLLGVTNTLDLGEGKRFTLTVRRNTQSGEWMPNPPMRMPRHHASRLGWLGLPKISGLEGAENQQLRFAIEVVSRRVEQRPKSRAWRAEYVVRVLSACLP